MFLSQRFAYLKKFPYTHTKTFVKKYLDLTQDFLRNQNGASITYSQTYFFTFYSFLQFLLMLQFMGRSSFPYPTFLPCKFLFFQGFISLFIIFFFVNEMLCIYYVDTNILEILLMLIGMKFRVSAIMKRCIPKQCKDYGEIVKCVTLNLTNLKFHMSTKHEI